MGKRIIDPMESARHLRETFMDRPHRRVQSHPWQWPRKLIEAGSCLAVMYSSDKWQKTNKHVDYKHVSEGPQTLYVRPRFIVDEDGEPMPLAGREVELAELPDVIALLAPIIGIQCQLYEEDDRGYFLPNGDHNVYQLDIPKAKLGAVRDVRGSATFLVVFTDAEGVLALISGRELDVLKDGIVG